MAELKFRGLGNKQQLVLIDDEEVKVLTDFGYNLTSRPTDYYVQAIASIFKSHEQISELVDPQPAYTNVIGIVSAMFHYMLRTNGRNIKVLALGNPEIYAYFQAQALKIFSENNSLVICDKTPQTDQWIELMDQLEVGEQITSVTGEYMRSLNALSHNGFDIVFIYEDTYEATLRDIVLAIKKLKPGGLLIGFYSEALQALFNDDYVIPIPGSSIWTKTITKESKESILMDYGYTVEKQTLNRLNEIGRAIESSLHQLDDHDDQDGLLRDIGVALSACERSVSELSNQSGYYGIKLALADVKEKYVTFRLNKQPTSLQETNEALGQWLKSLNEFEKWCVYER